MLVVSLTDISFEAVTSAASEAWNNANEKNQEAIQMFISRTELNIENLLKMNEKCLELISSAKTASKKSKIVADAYTNAGYPESASFYEDAHKAFTNASDRYETAEEAFKANRETLKLK